MGRLAMVDDARQVAFYVDGPLAGQIERLLDSRETVVLFGEYPWVGDEPGTYEHDEAKQITYNIEKVCRDIFPYQRRILIGHIGKDWAWSARYEHGAELAEFWRAEPVEFSPEPNILLEFDRWWTWTLARHRYEPGLPIWVSKVCDRKLDVMQLDPFPPPEPSTSRSRVGIGGENPLHRATLGWKT